MCVRRHREVSKSPRNCSGLFRARKGMMLLLEGSMLRGEGAGISGVGPVAALDSAQRKASPGGWQSTFPLGPVLGPLALSVFYFKGSRGLPWWSSV